MSKLSELSYLNAVKHVRNPSLAYSLLLLKRHAEMRDSASEYLSMLFTGGKLAGLELNSLEICQSH